MLASRSALPTLASGQVATSGYAWRRTGEEAALGRLPAWAADVPLGDVELVRRPVPVQGPEPVLVPVGQLQRAGRLAASRHALEQHPAPPASRRQRSAGPCQRTDAAHEALRLGREPGRPQLVGVEDRGLAPGRAQPQLGGQGAEEGGRGHRDGRAPRLRRLPDRPGQGQLQPLGSGFPLLSSSS
jgi:hypothetical protein